MENFDEKFDFRDPVSFNIKPVWNENSKILMLGSITSIDGLKSGFYYSSRWNSFWKLLDFVILSKKENLTFDDLEKLFLVDNKKFIFTTLKRKLNENYKQNYNKNHQIFNENLKIIQDEFNQALLNSNIAICDIFKSCYAKTGSSFDSDIVLDNKDFPFETYKDEIKNIITKSKVKIIIPNSNFVKMWLNSFDILPDDVKVVQVTSPSASRRLKLSVKFDDWKEKLSPYL